MHIMDSFSQTVLVVPASLLVFFIYKKFFAKDSDQKTISDTMVVGILMGAVLFLYNRNSNLELNSTTFRTKTNF